MTKKKNISTLTLEQEINKLKHIYGCHECDPHGLGGTMVELDDVLDLLSKYSLLRWKNDK